MLIQLSIRNIVLIERLDLSFERGLSVLTGETGAGKSILLDALGLALGDRAESGLISHGALEGSVTATFTLPPAHTLWGLIKESGLSVEDNTLILRRQLTKDGRSRAFINDQPVSLALLRQGGSQLVEIHGQFENQSLLNPATHRESLDTFGNLHPLTAACREAYHQWHHTVKAKKDAEETLRHAKTDEDYLRHNLTELDALSPQTGEEETLAAHRTLLMQSEKLIEGLKIAQQHLFSRGEPEHFLRSAQFELEKMQAKAQGALTPVIEVLDRAALTVQEAAQIFHQTAATINLDPQALEDTETRLFALRALARKHQVSVDQLSPLAIQFREKLAALDLGEAHLATLAQAESAAHAAYKAAADKLHEARQTIATTIDRAVTEELPPLRLEKALFQTTLEILPPEEWGPEGYNRVTFQASTNPGTPLSHIHKVASGGELARFMLALKVILSRVSKVPVLIFDEVDTGIGGATAAAVGDRLARLAEDLQVMVVTHSPQVAAEGDHHFKVEKSGQHKVSTTVSQLSHPERHEEIARMLSGETITNEARAAAEKLLYE